MTRLKAKPPADVQPEHSKLLIYSGPGGGKSWFATSFPSPYYIDTEGGAHLKHYSSRIKAAGGVYLGPDDGACDFDTVLGEMKTLATETHPYRTLVIDSITKVYQTAIARRAAELGDKDAFGASKKPAIGYMRQLVSWFPKMNMNIVLVAHDVALWGGEGKDRKQIGTGPDIWEKVPFELDLTLKIEKHSRGFRTATVDKSRLVGFPEFDRFDIQKDGKDVGYENFAARYGKDFIEAPAKPVVLATADQVAEIERILSFVKVEPEEIEKKLAKYGAETWADLTTEQAAGAIKWLDSLTKPKGGA